MEYMKHIDGKPSAWRGHLKTGYDLVNTFKPKVIVELGVMYGHSFFSFAQSVKDNNLDSVLYGIDNWTGDPHVGQYDPDEIYNTVEEIRTLIFSDLDIRLIRADFTEALPKVRHKIDLLHIDGSHDYDSVKTDWENYSKKLRKDAIVLFHDTMVPNFGVRQLFQEIQQEHPEWKYENREESYGLGIIYTGGEDSPID